MSRVKRRASLYSNSRKLVTGLVILVALGSGCRSPQEYARFAQAGATYAAALDSLLVASGNVAIDANSERLLLNDQLANQVLEDYERITSNDRARLKVIGQLRQHVRLMARYFGLLHELASSDAPARTQTSISGVITNLNALSTALRGSEFVRGNAPSLISGIVVSGIIRGGLREELRQRQPAIESELKLQEELLKALAASIEANLQDTQSAQEQRRVIGPLTAEAPVSNVDQWVTHRRAVLTSQTTIAELRDASKAVEKLNEAFADLTSGRLTLERANSLLSDFSALLAVAEDIRANRSQ